MWWRFRRHRLALVSAVVLILMYVVVLVPDFFSTQNPETTDARQAFVPIQGLHMIAAHDPRQRIFLLGSDRLGRDQWSRIKIGRASCRERVWRYV